ncbi:hypothetical protein KY321_03260 [Candidatus Woesearchaeota archaeon]|nr:hypothetical protein [Candidatus Woesearchaeota archaeon]
MLLKTLGILDIFTALCVLGLHFGVGNIKLSLFFSTYLILKLFISFKSINGYIDALIAIYIMGMHLVTGWFDYIIIIYLLQKGIVSLK